MSIKIQRNLTIPTKLKQTSWTVAAFFAACLLVPSGYVMAQDDSEIEFGAVLEEVLVTSRRYEERIEDAPLSVNVLDGEYLNAQGVANLNDIIELTPGATWAHFTMAQPGFTLRGMESYNVGNATLESAVQMVVDGVAITKAFMMTPPVYDLERVEVMRGPQGTTFGRNATLGIAHFITAKPSQDFSADVNLTVGTRGLFGVIGHVNGSLSDTISGRFAFHKKEYEGSLEDENTGKSLEGYDNYAVRASLMFEPSETFSAFLKFEYSKDDALAPARRHESCTVPTLVASKYINEYTANCNSWEASVSSPPPGGGVYPQNRSGFYEDREMFFATAELVWSVGDLTITSLSGYQDGELDTVMDVFASPEVIQDQIVMNDAEVLSTELRIDNKASGKPFTWLAGVYYLTDEELRIEHNIGMPPRGNGAGRINPLPRSDLRAEGFSELSSFGIFGELSFDIGDDWNLTVGGRYTDETKDYDFSNICWGRAGGCGGIGADPGGDYFYDPAYDCSKNVVNGICGSVTNPMGIGIPEPLHVSESWDNFSPKVSLSYSVNDNNNVYFLYSEGFKSGGFQHDARNAQSFYESIVGPETVENFELGWKGSYDTFRFALTVFTMEQKDAQNSVLVPLPSGSYVTDIRNYGGIEMNGLEFEATWLVNDNFLMGGNLAFYDGELGPDSYTGARWDPECLCVIGVDVSGLSTGLKNTFVIWGEYKFDLSGGSNLQLRADLQHRSTVYPPAVRFTVKTLDGEGLAFERPEINNLGANVTWTSADQNWQVSLWGKNLLDEFDWGGWGPASSFHFNNGGSGPGTAPRNYEGRRRYGMNVRWMFF